MNRFQMMFGSIDKTVETMRSMNCLDPDDFRSCEGCAFWECKSYTGDPCPQYPDGVKLGNRVPPSITNWLATEWLAEEA